MFQLVAATMKITVNTAIEVAVGSVITSGKTARIAIATAIPATASRRGTRPLIGRGLPSCQIAPAA